MTWRYTGQKKEVNISVGDEEIDSVHRAGRGNSKNNEPRPILIEFSWPPGKVKSCQKHKNFEGQRCKCQRTSD